MGSVENTGRLRGCKVLVTGASRGIGREIALRFATEGADLCLCATNPETLEVTAGEVRSLGQKAAVFVTDVSDRAAVDEMVGSTVNKLGRIDVLVNNAGVYVPARFVDYTYEEFDHVMQVNLYGAFYVMQSVVRRMLSQGAGKVINIASTAGKWGSVNQSAYNASKHALVGLTRCVALETAGQGLQVNAICPGFVETDMAKQFEVHAAIQRISSEEMKEIALSRVPLRRFMETSDVAHLAVYLASSESDGMTGQSIVLDGGMVLV